MQGAGLTTMTAHTPAAGDSSCHCAESVSARRPLGNPCAHDDRPNSATPYLAVTIVEAADQNDQHCGKSTGAESGSQKPNQTYAKHAGGFVIHHCLARDMRLIIASRETCAPFTRDMSHFINVLPLFVSHIAPHCCGTSLVLAEHPWFPRRLLPARCRPAESLHAAGRLAARVVFPLVEEHQRLDASLAALCDDGLPAAGLGHVRIVKHEPSQSVLQRRGRPRPWGMGRDVLA
eukprot:364036-Chlamydomonas_euryale.AAC.3